jgi:hypothetical protein
MAALVLAYELSRVFRAAFAGRMTTGAINVGGLFHRLALRAAVLARSHGTRADGMRAFLSFRIGHE